jgi:chromosome partitioning protein
MHVIAVSNRKGGTGKTTVSVNLAAELAALGLRTLLIDLDSQGHCGIALGLRPHTGQPNVHQLFTNPEARLTTAIQPTPFANLWLVPADPLFDHSQSGQDDYRLKNALVAESLAERFDLVLIDTPPSLDRLLINGLLAANRVLVPYIPHYISVESMRQLVRLLFRIMTRQNRELKILGFVPTLSAEHIRQHRTVNAQVGGEFGAARILPGIRNDIRLAESFAAGKPVRLYAPKSRSAQDFARLGQAVILHLELPVPPASSAIAP